jgi:hypothetical protein
LYHYFIRSDSQIHSIENSDVENAKSALLSVKELYDISPGGDEFRQLLDFMAYIHLGISIMYRVSYSNAVRTREITRGVISYLDGNFPSWRRSKFLKLGFVLNKGPKYIGLWGIAWFYKHNMEMVFINTYRFVHDKLKIDIKW